LTAIQEQSLPDVLAAYALLGQRSLSLAKRKKPNSDDRGSDFHFA